MVVWIDRFGIDVDLLEKYDTVIDAREDLIEWCKEHRNEFVNFYRAKNSYHPFGSMVWFENENKPGWFKMWGCDDRDECAGVSEGLYFIKENGRLE